MPRWAAGAVLTVLMLGAPGFAVARSADDPAATVQRPAPTPLPRSPSPPAEGRRTASSPAIVRLPFMTPQSIEVPVPVPAVDVPPAVDLPHPVSADSITLGTHRLPSPQSEQRFAHWLDGALVCDSALVMRLDVREVTARDPDGRERVHWQPRVASQAWAGLEWIHDFTQLIANQRWYEAAGICDLAESAVGHDDMVYAIRFAGGDTEASVMVLLGESCLSLRSHERNAGRLDATDIGRPLHALLFEAFSDDEVVRRHQEALRHSAPALPIYVERLERGALPGFGEYVYVEELPEAVTKAAPVYPDVAREAGVAGTVLLQCLVGTTGAVRDVRVQKSIPMLDKAAIEAVYHWHFKPALSKGEPVAVWVAVPVKFTLH